MNTGELQRQRQGQGLGSKGQEQINHSPPGEGGKACRSCQGEDSGMEPCPSGHPWFAHSGCKKPSPFPEVQPLLSHSELGSHLFHFIQPATRGCSTHTRTRW